MKYDAPFPMGRSLSQLANFVSCQFRLLSAGPTRWRVFGSAHPESRDDAAQQHNSGDQQFSFPSRFHLFSDLLQDPPFGKAGQFEC